MKRTWEGVKLRGVMGVALSFLAVTTHAETWLQIADLDKKGSALLLETTAIDRTLDVRQASFKSIYAVDQPIADGFRDVPSGVRTFHWRLDQGQFNCKDRTVALSKSTLHGVDNEVVGTVEVAPADLRFREFPLQSSGSLLLQSVCSGPTPEGQPEPPPARLKSAANPDDYYPARSRRRGEAGAPVVRVCIGPTGALLREPEITDTSGFPALDAAAIKVAKGNRYAPAIENGAAAPESCIKFKVKFGR